MRKLAFILAFFLNIEIFSAVRILTFHYNQPNFIEIQYKTLKKFLKDDFELIVFNDAKTKENATGIENTCHKYGIQCIRFEPEWHLSDPLNTYLKTRLQEPSTIGWWGWDKSTSVEELASHPSVRHSHVIQYALDHYGYDHDDIVVIMDGDNFLIKPLSIRKLLLSRDVVSFHQRSDPQADGRKQSLVSVPKNTEMPWVVFIAFDPNKIPNPRELQFHVDVVNNRSNLPNNTIVDTGAAMYKYLEKYPYLKIIAYHWQDAYTYRSYFNNKELKKLGLNDSLIRFIHDISPGNVQFFLCEHFLHFGASSFHGIDHDHKVYHLCKFTDEILNENQTFKILR